MLHLNSQELGFVCVCALFISLFPFIWWRTWHEIYIANIFTCLFSALYIACMTFMSPPSVELSWLHAGMCDCVSSCMVWMPVHLRLFIWMTSLIQYIFPSFSSFQIQLSAFSSFVYLCLFGVSFEIHHSHLTLGVSWNVPSIKVTSCFTFNFADT